MAGDLPALGSHEIAPAKLSGYLLNPDSKEGAGKAAFFSRFGFSREQPHELGAALLRHPHDHAVEATLPGSHGTKHLVRCTLITPDGRNPCVLSVWIVEPGAAPRLLTAYPG